MCYRSVRDALVLLSLAGCASDMVFDKTGASEADLRRDGYACERDVQTMPDHDRPGGMEGMALVLARANTKDRIFIDCMQSKGWTYIGR